MARAPRSIRRSRASRPLPRARRIAITQTAERDRLISRAEDLYVGEARKLIASAWDLFDEWIFEHGVTDAISNTELLNLLRGRFDDPENMRAVFGRLAGLVEADVDEAVRKAIPAIERERFASTGSVERYSRQNAALIKNVGEEIRNRVAKTIAQGEGKHVTTLRRDFEKAAEISENRARLWARDQTLKLHSQITQERHRALGINEYYWTDSNDERVRQIHRDLGERSDRGETFQYTNPPVCAEDGRRGNPGEDYQCRCTAFPRLDRAPIELPSRSPSLKLRASEEEPAPIPPPPLLLGASLISARAVPQTERLLVGVASAATALAREQVNAIQTAAQILRETPNPIPAPVRRRRANYVSQVQIPGTNQPLSNAAQENYAKMIRSAEQRAAERTAEEFERRREAARFLASPDIAAREPERARRIVYATQVGVSRPARPRVRRPTKFLDPEAWLVELNALERRALDKRLTGGPLSDPEFNRLLRIMRRSPFATISELLAYWEANRVRALT